MSKFVEDFETIDGHSGKIILKHTLFGTQIFNCSNLKVLNDNNRIGVIIKHQDIYINKDELQQVIHNDNTYILSDKRTTITINVNNV